MDELDDAKLDKVLLAKYHTLDLAGKKLGTVKEIQQTFIGLQENLYKDAV